MLENGYIAFDLETTGVDVETARIVTAAAVTVSPVIGTVVDEWTINPGIPIPAEATAVHGVTNEAASRGREPRDALMEIAATVLSTSCLVVYNAPYDLTVLDRELRRHGLPLLPTARAAVYRPGSLPAVVDPLVIDKALDRYRKGSRRLVDVCAHYGIHFDDAHSADADAVAAGRLAEALMPVLEETCGAMDLRTLHTLQVSWSRQQQESFAVYLRGKARGLSGGEREAVMLKADSVARDWPFSST